ncbi:MAG: hypothetical protein ACI9GM_001587 [Salibacteraceae bacterium]|jgi:hypothetical protein
MNDDQRKSDNGVETTTVFETLQLLLKKEG